MVTPLARAPEIVRTERGLTIAGTRLSLYEILDFLKIQYPPKLIQYKFNLTDAQIEVALAYINTNRDAVEAEYQEVLKTREEIRQYWEDKNRDRLVELRKKYAEFAPQSGSLRDRELLLKKLKQQRALQESNENSSRL